MTRQITSCLTCRRRKVRCDRTLPACSVCINGSYPCSYRVRDAGRRRSFSPPLGLPPSPQSDPSGSTRPRAWANVPSNGGGGQDALTSSNTNTTTQDQANDYGFNTDSSETCPYEAQLSGPSFNGLIFGSCSPKPSPLQYYPSTRANCRYLLDRFLQNFETAVHLCHRPTLLQNFEAHVADLERPQSASTLHTDRFQSLAFAIFFAATYTMSSAEIAATFSSTKASLSERFQRGLTLALDRENFLSSPSIPVLQAFVIFMTCKCRDDDMQQVWALVGLAVRIAQSLSLHQEPTLLEEKLDAVQVETRRRLWHQIFYIDFRAAVSKGLPPLIAPGSYTTCLPSNVNDDSLVAGQECIAKDYNPVSFTEMTMQLVRLNGTHSMQQLLHMAPRISKAQAQDLGSEDLGRKEQEMRLLIETTVEKNQMLYISHCNSSIPLQRLTQSLANHIKWKFWMIYHRRFVREQDQGLSSAQSTLIFSRSLNLIHSFLQISQDKELDPFRWMIDLHSILNAGCHILDEMEDAKAKTRIEPQLLQQARQLLKSMQDLNSTNTNKSWLSLNDRINRVLKPAEPALEVEAATAPAPTLEDTAFTDFFVNGNITGIDYWTTHMAEFM